MLFSAMKSQPSESKTVKLADGQTFELLVRKPTLAERLNVDGLQALAYAGVQDAWANVNFARFESVIVGWSGVDEPGDQPKPVEFSQANLKAVMTAFPETVRQVQQIAVDQFNVFPKGSDAN